VTRTPLIVGGHIQRLRCVMSGITIHALHEVPIMTADHRPPARLGLRNRLAGLWLRCINPFARRMIPAGIPTGASNVLLTVPGRRSGRPRTVPLGIVVLDDRTFVQASFGETGWVANVRAAGQATVTYPGGRSLAVQAIELSPDEAGAVLRRVLEPYHRSRLLGALLGSQFRPPIGVLWRIHVRIDDTTEEYVAEARRHPLFELRPLTEASATLA
jgi:deazaflavin-dependent oxidoreductase (nitroreductase family)